MNIIYLIFTDLSFYAINEYHKLHELIEDYYKENRNNYLFADKIQFPLQLLIKDK